MIVAIVSGLLAIIPALITVFAAKDAATRIREEIQDLQRIRSSHETPEAKRAPLAEAITERIDRLLELRKARLPVRRLYRLVVSTFLFALALVPVILSLQSQASSHDRSAAYLQIEQTQAATAFRDLPRPLEGAVLSRSWELQDQIESLGNQANQQRNESTLDRDSAIHWAAASIISDVASFVLAIPLLVLTIRDHRRTHANTSQKRRLRFRMSFGIYPP